MKKLILVISISLIISIGLMSYRKSINQNQLHNRNIKLKRHFKNKFTNAEVIGYCKNGKIMYKGNFKNGKKNGEWITYYKNEKIKSKEIYKDGKPNGEWITYDENGEIKYIRNYKDGRKISSGTMSKFKSFH